MWNFSHALGGEAVALFSDRGVDFCLRDPGDVFGASQREWLNRAGVAVNRVATIQQVHGDAVIHADERYVSAGCVIAADAAVTATDGVVLTIRTADCVPVFLYDRDHRAVGLIHAGWRSAAAGIIAKTVGEMSTLFGSDPGEMRALIGPCVHACCYEVGQDLCERFPHEMVLRQGRWFLDLPAACLRHLEEAGVPRAAVTGVPMCTCCDGGFFSYRREGAGTGRHLSLLWLRH